MTRRVASTAVAIALAFSLLSTLPGFAAENKYTEDFTTTQYKDTLNTTADWDTVAGELGLFPFAPTNHRGFRCKRAARAYAGG